MACDLLEVCDEYGNVISGVQVLSLMLLGQMEMITKMGGY